MPHVIYGNVITVVRQLPKKKLPLDPVKVHVQGISETSTEDCLHFYLEKFSDAEVMGVYLGCNNDALAIFESEPGNFKTLSYIHSYSNREDSRPLICRELWSMSV